MKKSMFFTFIVMMFWFCTASAIAETAPQTSGLSALENLPFITGENQTDETEKLLKLTSTGAPVSLAEYGVNGIASVITVPDKGYVTEAKVKMDTTTGLSENLAAYLVSPSGFFITLHDNQLLHEEGWGDSDDMGEDEEWADTEDMDDEASWNDDEDFGEGEGWEDDVADDTPQIEGWSDEDWNAASVGITTIFKDDAEVFIYDAQAPYQGTYLPLDFFMEFYGENLTGEWILVILNTNGADANILNSWEIKFLYTDEPPEWDEEWDEECQDDEWDEEGRDDWYGEDEDMEGGWEDY